MACQRPGPIPLLELEAWAARVGTEPVGGTLAQCHDQWAALGASAWLLTVVRDGFLPTLTSHPQLAETPIMQTRAPAEVKHEQIKNSITELLQKGAVTQPHQPVGPGFYSLIFTKPKKTGGLRPSYMFLRAYLHKMGANATQFGA